MTINALILGVGGPTILGIAKSLRLKVEPAQLRMVGADGDSFAPGLYNRQLFDSTCINGSAKQPDYWHIMQDIVDREAIDLAFVTAEGEVLAWSERQESHGLPCKALIPQYGVAQSMYDKMACNEILSATALVPRTINIESEPSPERVGSELGYPYWVRKSKGAGAIGALKIEEEKDLRLWQQMNPDMEGMIASEFLPGRNFACKVLYINGELVRAACAERITYLLAKAAPSGISGMCARGRLVNHSDLISRSDTAVRAVFSHHAQPPHGMYTVDFKEDADGVPKITEINIRHVSFTYAFSLGGANFAYDIFEYLTEGELSSSGFREYRFDGEPHFIRGVDSEIFIMSDEQLVRAPGSRS